jgi:hypothetical protein
MRGLILGILITQVEEQTDESDQNDQHQDDESPRLHEVHHTLPSFLTMLLQGKGDDPRRRPIPYLFTKNNKLL